MRLGIGQLLGQNGRSLGSRRWATMSGASSRRFAGYSARRLSSTCAQGRSGEPSSSSIPPSEPPESRRGKGGGGDPGNEPSMSPVAQEVTIDDPASAELTSGVGMGISWDDVVTLALSLAFAFLVKEYVVETRYIPSLSMFPTLEEGDRLVTEKLTYRFVHPPERGDMIIFYPPSDVVKGQDPSTTFIKRVVALEGDTVEVKRGKLFLNGTQLDESYMAEPIEYKMPRIKVPPGCVWVMGDNRNASLDSHAWGPLPLERVVARVVFEYWPPQHVRTIPDVRGTYAEATNGESLKDGETTYTWADVEMWS